MNLNWIYNWRSSAIKEKRIFAVLVDGELATNIFIANSSNSVDEQAITAYDITVAAMASNPTIIEITHLEDIPPIGQGYTWNGTSFDPPV